MDASQFDAADDRAFVQAHGDMLHHADIQFSFPVYKAPEVPQWVKWLEKTLGNDWPAIKWGLWIVAGVIVLWILYSLARQYGHLLRWNRKAEARREWPAEQPWRPTEAQARQLLAEADALAAQGRYGEAVHLLLLRSIEEIEARRPRLLRRALTSREIGGLSGLPEAARPTFRGIARAVEQSRFAGEAIDAATFARCREDYEAFAFAPVWQLAA
jgi:hypothetical protein